MKIFRGKTFPRLGRQASGPLVNRRVLYLLKIRGIHSLRLAYKDTMSFVDVIAFMPA